MSSDDQKVITFLAHSIVRAAIDDNLPVTSENLRNELLDLAYINRISITHDETRTAIDAAMREVIPEDADQQ